jgi:hypothetical protein
MPRHRVDILSLRLFGWLGALVATAALFLEFGAKKVVTFDIPLPVLSLGALGLLAQMVYAARWKDHKRLLEALLTLLIMALGVGAIWIATSHAQLLPHAPHFVLLVWGWIVSLVFVSLGTDAVNRNTQREKGRIVGAAG